ncbi:MAG: AMP-binding protein, partial [Clostridia bacterium]|nr:AMP-binding protein [Clostridia bacterium]
YEPEIGVPAPGHLNFEDLAAFGKSRLDLGATLLADLEPDLSRTAAILFTSGTTGTAKGVMLSHTSLVAAINASYNMTNFHEKDVIVSVLPVHHTYEMTCGILTPILIGCTVCINDSLKRVVKNFQLFHPTGLVLVPLFVSTLYKKVWETAKKSGRERLLKGSIAASGILRKVKIDPRKLFFKSVRDAFGGKLERIICGGAPMEANLVKEFDDFGIALCQGYGITECAPLIAVCPEKANRAGSVGLPVPGLEVRVDKEEGEDYGEIVVKGPNVMQGYFGDEEATRAVLEEDGWFHTGDFGYQDEDGYLYVTGRKKNVIVLDNGKNVFPEEIEEYLEKIDLICEVAVIGRRNDEGAVTVTACVYPDFAKANELGLGEDLNAIGAALTEDIAALNRTLPAFKQIRGVELRRTEFDKTTTHKIKRYKLEQ